MQDFEKLGVFYLGKAYDPAARRTIDEKILYDARDLTTHAVCVGMTGSGKTGLGVGLVEEAAIDGIPALVVDPKGDLTNLLLTFPKIAPADFQPWIDGEEARRRETTVEQLAAEEAARWQQGLAEWDEDGERIRRLRDAAEFAVYTPGSTAGRRVSILSSFAAPGPAIRGDADLLNEHAASAATSLLGLLGIDADPLRSREHILLTTLFVSEWQPGRDVDLGRLIQLVQKPPFARVGVMDLEVFFPEQERFALAMAINNVLAAPSFQEWLSGEPLDIGRLLYGESGKPRIAIFSIAHLGDQERMFFVSLLFNQTIAWMRSQSGTSSLRAMLYMDEVFGYCPPTANPPSKPPLLVLLKQARAFGVGVVLATQNPVDLDYKGLANAGTWFIGKLQTERDRARLLDGLLSAGAKLDRAAIEKLLDAVGKRIFLLHNVHDDAPQLFSTRWTLSYLRGPMTREEIRRLGQGSASPAASVGPAAAGLRAAAPATAALAGAPPGESLPPAARPTAFGAPASPGTTDGTAPPEASGAPTLPPDVPQAHLTVRGTPPAGAALVYVPHLLGRGAVRFSDAKAAVESHEEVALLVALPESPAEAAWTDGRDLDPRIDTEPAPPASLVRYGPLTAPASQARSYTRWTRELADWLYRNRRLELLQCADPRLTAKPGESEREFRARLADALREARDARAEALRAKYGPRLARLEEQRRRAEQTRDREAEQAQREKVQTAVSVGATILGAFLGGGRRSTVGRATTVARGLGRARAQASDVGRAIENVEAIEQRLAALSAEFEAEVAAESGRIDAQGIALSTVAVRPKKADVAVRSVILAWAPFWEDTKGARLPAWE